MTTAPAVAERPGAERATRALRLAPEHAVTLALLRIAVCVIVLASSEVRDAARLAALPAALRIAPEGLGWFVAIAPIAPGVARVAQLGLVFSAMCGLVGYRARAAMTGVALFGFYVLALSQLGGAVLHDMHLVWFAAVLAASPCGDALTLLPREGPARPARSIAYAEPLIAVRALLAAIYFFPGSWKLREAGVAWAWSDNLRNQMYAKWFEWGWVPAVRLDASPVLLRLGAAGVLAFELAFPLLMLTRRTRLVAVVVGLAFHLSSAALLRIHFPSLWVCYVALVDWGPLADRLRPAPPPTAPSRTPSLALRALGAALVVGAMVQGARGAMFAWPLACYPTFQRPMGTTLPDLVLEAERDDGSVVTIDSGGQGRGRAQARWGQVWALAGLTGAPADRGRLVAYWNAVDHRAAVGAARGRAVRVRWSTLPEDRDRPPLAREVLATFALDRYSAAAE
jgi:hypothetical protein